MPIISAVGLFCFDEFEETPNEKVSNMSKLTKLYFRSGTKLLLGKLLLLLYVMRLCTKPPTSLTLVKGLILRLLEF